MQASNLSIVCWQTLIASLSHARIIRNHHGQQSYKQTAVVAHVSAAWSRPGLLEQLGDFCSQSDGVDFCCQSDGVDFCSQSDGVDFCRHSDGDSSSCEFEDDAWFSMYSGAFTRRQSKTNL